VARTVTEESRQIPVCADVDVAVCGGGPAGVAAALAAARNGASVILLENQLCLGGQSTSGMMNRLGPYHDQEATILGGIPWEVIDNLVRRDAAHLPTPCPHGEPCHDQLRNNWGRIRGHRFFCSRAMSTR